VYSLNRPPRLAVDPYKPQVTCT